MARELPQHTRLDGSADHVAALDTLSKLTRQKLYLFDRDFDGLGYDTEARHVTLRNFLLASPANQLFVLAHDVGYLGTRCPRMITLLHQFGTSMFIYQTPRHLQRICVPFSVADATNYVRRFHFDDPRGILALHDPETARALQSRFLGMWTVSGPAPATSQLRL